MKLKEKNEAFNNEVENRCHIGSATCHCKVNNTMSVTTENGSLALRRWPKRWTRCLCICNDQRNSCTIWLQSHLWGNSMSHENWSRKDSSETPQEMQNTAHEIFYVHPNSGYTIFSENRPNFWGFVMVSVTDVISLNWERLLLGMTLPRWPSGVFAASSFHWTRSERAKFSFVSWSKGWLGGVDLVCVGC